MHTKVYEHATTGNSLQAAAVFISNRRHDKAQAYKQRQDNLELDLRRREVEAREKALRSFSEDARSPNVRVLTDDEFSDLTYLNSKAESGSALDDDETLRLGRIMVKLASPEARALTIDAVGRVDDITDDE